MSLVFLAAITPATRATTKISFLGTSLAFSRSMDSAFAVTMLCAVAFLNVEILFVIDHIRTIEYVGQGYGSELTYGVTPLRLA